MKTLLIRLVLLFSVALACIYGLSYRAVRRTLYSSVDAELLAQVSIVSSNTRSGSDVPDLLFQISNLNGQTTRASEHLSPDFRIPDEIREKTLTDQRCILATLTEPGLGTVRSTTCVWRDSNGLASGLITVLIPLSKFDQQLRTTLLQLFAESIALLVISTFVVFLLLRQWLRPVQQITHLISETSTGAFPQWTNRIAPSDDEIGRLSAALQSVLARVEKSVRSQQRFLADAAHELRTPLAVLRGEIEVALRKIRTPEEYQEVFRSNLEELERISRLINNLLTLAQADSGDRLVHHETIDLSLLCREVCCKLQPLADRKGVRLDLVADPEAPYSGDRLGLERVISNIVDNAIRYTPAPGSVVVTLQSAGSSIRITVTDTGPGIPAEDLPHIFERFYRVDRSAAAEKASGGLGLAIAKTLVQAHGGRIEASSPADGGAVFTLTFPR